jgi:putative ABC transport system ATP-binding protein
MMTLELTDLSVSFPGLGAPVLAIDHLKLSPGTRLAVTGASGSGKSTFANLIAGLMRPDRGHVAWRGVDIATFPQSKLDRWRGQNVGLVMQDFHLFAGLSALDNILLPTRLTGLARPEHRTRALELLGRVGLGRPGQRVETMSRGEMQRVAVARALLRRPGIVIADEPTASLDPEAGAAVGRLLIELADDEGAMLIVISHDERLTTRLDRRIRLGAGRIADDSANGECAA